MKSQKGVTLVSLAIYLTVVLIVLGVLAVISGVFQGNIKEIYSEGTNNAEVDKFNVYFLKEVKTQGNAISTISDNEIKFSTGNEYIFNDSVKCIYLNNIKIAENIEKCIFTTSKVNEKTVITVNIKAIKGEEKNIQYVLVTEEAVDSSNEEIDYTNYVPQNWDVSKLNRETPVHFEVIDNEAHVVPIPRGFKVSTIDGENSIKEGLVIYDGESDTNRNNEFVWVPVDNASEYEEGSFGPLAGVYEQNGYIFDSYQMIQYFYGTALGTINNDASFNEIFTYGEDKTNIENNIKKYGGFYVGRYETTYDSTDTNGIPQGIGVKRGNNVLQASNILQTGTNLTSNEECFYRWWGLYKVQKDMYMNNENVGSIMISDNQWEAIMEFTDYEDGQRLTDTYTNPNGPDLSGSVYRTDDTEYDEVKNIYDLAGNLYEWTMKAEDTDYRHARGGSYSNSSDAVSYGRLLSIRP